MGVLSIIGLIAAILLVAAVIGLVISDMVRSFTSFLIHSFIGTLSALFELLATLVTKLFEAIADQ